MTNLALILDDRLAIVGTTGSGKTYAAKGMAEALITGGARVCIVDPLSVWWGLRAGADGDAAAGLPVVILGGTHGDVPIGEHDGEKLGRMLASTAAQCVVDVSELGSGAAQRRFMRAFLTALYDNNREPLHLVLDEADLWAPQRPGPEHAVLGGKVSEIVRRGRVRGFIPWLITQRPAVLDKDVLSQADVLIAMKLTASQDRAAIGGWIEGQGDRAFQKKLLAALPRLERGTGWVWAPGRAMLEQVTFPPIATFDSSRTPERGEQARPLGRLAAVDAAAFAALLQAEPAAHDAAAPLGGELDRAYRRGRAEGYDEGFEAGKIAWANSLLEATHRFTEALRDAGARFAEHANHLQPIQTRQPGPSAATAPEPEPQAATSQDGADRTADALAAGAKRILKVLAARHPARLSEAQWATLARMTRTGGTWTAYRRSLQGAGMVEHAGRRWSVTPAGLAESGAASRTPMSPAEVLTQWKTALGTGPARLLDALLAHPEGLTREQLAALVRMSPGGGSFNAYTRALINHELAVPGRGKRIRLADSLRQQDAR